MKETEKLSYEKALEELEILIKQVENPENSLENIEKAMKEALSLLSYAEGLLKNYEGKVMKLSEES